MDKFQLVEYLLSLYPKTKYPDFKIVASKTTEEVIVWINEPHLHRTLISDMLVELENKNWIIHRMKGIAYKRYRTWGFFDPLRIIDLIRTKTLKHICFCIKNKDESSSNK